VVAMNVSYEFFTTSYSCPATSKMFPARPECRVEGLRQHVGLTLQGIFSTFFL
jgi:hypothetical protein